MKLQRFLGILGQSTAKWGRVCCRNLLRVLQLWSSSLDLLDHVIILSFSLLTTGSYLLWGTGWACMMLGGLLLGLVVIGIPVKAKSS